MGSEFGEKGYRLIKPLFSSIDDIEKTHQKINEIIEVINNKMLIHEEIECHSQKEFLGKGD